MAIHPQTEMGPVHYHVAHLQTQIIFYRDHLGFELLNQEGDTATLGTSKRELLRLTQLHGSKRVRGRTGLYHTAFLVPNRIDLARLVQRLIDTRTPIQGTSNHGTHLAIYLPDPEGNGIELAWDFPKEQWPMIGGKPDFFNMPRQGVDVDELLHELEGVAPSDTALHPDTKIGHIHLHVADLDTSRAFYNELLGFDVMLDGQEMGALFVSAGGYHHHIGMNIWKGAGTPPPPPNATGLKYFTIEIPDKEHLERLVARIKQSSFDVTPREDGFLVPDPSENHVLLKPKQV